MWRLSTYFSVNVMDSFIFDLLIVIGMIFNGSRLSLCSLVMLARLSSY